MSVSCKYKSSIRYDSWQDTVEGFFFLQSTEIVGDRDGVFLPREALEYAQGLVMELAGNFDKFSVQPCIVHVFD